MAMPDAPTAAPVTELAPDLHAATSELRMPGGVRFPIRMTIARLPSGGLWLHSPLRATDELAAQVSALGPVEHLVAPNRYHHLYLRGWKERFPAAQLHGAPGLATKRGDLAFDAELGDAPPAAWQDAFDAVSIAGVPKMSEVVFVHRPSRSLLVTDLVFNVTELPNLRTRVALTLTGTAGKLAYSRIWRLLRKDRAALEASLDRVVALDFDRLVPCHGTVLASGAHAAIARALGRAEAAAPTTAAAS